MPHVAPQGRRSGGSRPGDSGIVERVLEVDGLVRTYGPVRALDGMTFGVRPGSVTGFLGPNGAGKTTTMRAIFGLIALDAGEVRWNGRPIDHVARRRFGYLPEERGLYPSMKVLEQLRYLGQLRGLPRDVAAAEATRWLGELSVWPTAPATSWRTSRSATSSASS